MMFLILVCVVGMAAGQTLPHGADLKQLVDARFSRLDHSPTDGVVTENEWDVLLTREDLNNDTCVSLTEYEQASPAMPTTMATTMFHHFDHDADGCLKVSDLSAEFHLVDHNGDNSVSLHEWEQYFTHLITKLFGHGAGHGNPVGR
ncbi:uncharacterized protein LOC127834733 isoform X1 [Dreissena polymorpha]|uniref:EF-hand domain-containing protein n=2 Tax=Dreissena polymorpha TaxID=45954 RepID=A0A9D4JDN6_DREPO|nr:uncharacterized protein LOC127834733 isoform X1 [Dreissena polymorpha]KAH3805939.1 hypothetical protein DPMN_134249 [Dreissena polymorpha]